MADHQPSTKKYVSRIAVLQQVEAALRERIRGGAWSPGTLLPSRRDLAAEYGIDLNTLQRAIAPLLADGTLQADGGRGTFVAAAAEEGRGTFAAVSTEGGRGTFVAATATGGEARISSGASLANATLGMVYTLFPDATDIGAFWTRLAVRAIENAFSLTGATIVSRNRAMGGPVPEPIGDALRALLGQGVAGIVVEGINDAQETADEVIAAVDPARMPIVYMSWHPTRYPLAHVYYDSGYEGYQAAQHLLGREYRRIAFIKPYEAYWIDGRIAGASQAVHDSRSAAGELTVFPPGPWPTGASSSYGDMGYDAMRRALQSVLGADGPWGVIAPNDFTAFGLLRAAEEAGLRPGRDIGIVGFDDDPNSAAAGLTTVRRPFETLGRAAAEMLIRELRGDRSSLEVKLRSELIPRSSTRLAPAQGPSQSLKDTREVILS